MKAISLLLLRLSTGIYLILWGLIKLTAAEKANSLSDAFYGGLISGDMINLGLGSLQVIVGALVALGLARTFSYTAQLIWYLAGLAPIIFYILDPFGKYLVESSRLTWFPSTTLLFASMIIIAFREYDTISIDAKRGN